MKLSLWKLPSSFAEVNEVDGLVPFMTTARSMNSSNDKGLAVSSLGEESRGQ